MAKRPIRIGLLALFVFTTVPAFAAESRPPQWYEVATGVIATPAALIGLAYSYLLIRKTRLEARKTELEIREKERALEQIVSAHQTSELAALITPVGEGRIVLLLLLRFVVLWLILTAWGLLEDAFEILFAGVVIGVQQIWHWNVSTGWAVVPLIAIQKLPKAAYWVVFFAVAWPLFRDVNAALGVDLKTFFTPPRLRELRRAGKSSDGSR